MGAEVQKDSKWREASKQKILSLCVEERLLHTLSANGIKTLAKLNVGRTNAIRTNGYDYSETEIRALRRGVSELRAIGIPVINTSDGSGYYIADLMDEDDRNNIAVTRNLLTARIEKLTRASRGLTCALEIAFSFAYSGEQSHENAVCGRPSDGKEMVVETRTPNEIAELILKWENSR